MDGPTPTGNRDLKDGVNLQRKHVGPKRSNQANMSCKTLLMSSNRFIYISCLWFWRWVRIRIMVFQHATSCFDHLHSRFIYGVAVTIHWSMNLFIQNKVFINFLLKKNLGINWDTSMKQGTLYTPLHFLSGRKVHPTETPRGRSDSIMISEHWVAQDRGCGSSVWNCVYRMSYQ